IENRNIFDYRLTGSEAGGQYDSDVLFYSRRIGGPPHRRIGNDPDIDYYADEPSNMTILGAAKFSGKTRSGLSIGILESITQREMATIDYEGVRSEEVVEPLTNFFVGRVQQDYNEGNTVIGGILTSVVRHADDADLDGIHRTATTGGLDFTHRWGNRAWVLRGNLVASQVTGNAEVIRETQEAFEHLFQRPDAEHLEVDTTATSLTGTSGTLTIANYGGDWIFETGATWRSPQLELNDIGFLTNTDEINYFAWGARRWQQPFGIFRRVQWNGNIWSRWDFSGRNLYRAANSNAHFFFKNFWRTGLGFTGEQLDISKNALRGGPAVRRPVGGGFNLYLQSDSRKKIMAGVNGFYGGSYDGVVKFTNAGMFVQWQPINAMSINVSPSFTRNRRREQYVTQLDYQGETVFINGRVDQQTFSTTVRLNYNITPDLTIQFYGQPFISRGQYRDFNRLTDDPLGKTFGDRFHIFKGQEISYDAGEETYLVDEDLDGTTDYSFGRPDFNFIQFRSNLVIRWEYTPGSELYLVWSQGANALDDPDRTLFRALGDNLFGENATNTFLIKATYRFFR
ncbi:MAG: hydrolase, partial [Lewinella sp.]|nr:hydrolase [Lewinella sp.]